MRNKAALPILRPAYKRKKNKVAFFGQVIGSKVCLLQA
jgi:hypothetical protein